MADIYRNEYQVLLKHLRQARKGKGLTQYDVAARLAKSQSFVNKIEIGERRLDVVQLRDFCLALEIDFIEFLHGYNAELQDASD